MKTLPLIIAPNPLLKQISKPVEKIDEALRQFMKEMVNTMYAESGVGLAAVQVGVLKRVLVIDVDYESEDHHHHHHDHHGCGGVHVKNTNPRFFINPEIIELSKELESYNEGCLSFPDMRSEVIRPEKVTVKYLDFDGNPLTKIPLTSYSPGPLMTKGALSPKVISAPPASAWACTAASAAGVACALASKAGCTAAS